MDQSTLSRNKDNPAPKPKRATGLGWEDFFQWLGQGTVVAEHRGPLPKPVQD